MNGYITKAPDVYHLVWGTGNSVMIYKDLSAHHECLGYWSCFQMDIEAVFDLWVHKYCAN